MSFEELLMALNNNKTVLCLYYRRRYGTLEKKTEPVRVKIYKREDGYYHIKHQYHKNSLVGRHDPVSIICNVSKLRKYYNECRINDFKLLEEV